MESRSRLRIVVFKIICILYRSNGMKILGLSDLGIYESASLNLCANLLFTNYGLKQSYPYHNESILFSWHAKNSH